MHNTIDFNRCIQGIYNFGSTTFTNICDGTNHVVPWGTMDWIFITTGLGIAMLIGIGAAVYRGS